MVGGHAAESQNCIASLCILRDLCAALRSQRLKAFDCKDYGEIAERSQVDGSIATKSGHSESRNPKTDLAHLSFTCRPYDLVPASLPVISREPGGISSMGTSPCCRSRLRVSAH